VRRDFSLLLNKSVQYKEIAQLALSIDKSLLKNVNLFDVYEGEKLAQDKKSYAVSFHFQDGDRTLTDQEIDTVMERIKLALESKLEAQLR
jgi:phenylalanyl-tRNA synthetase beta chain